MKEVNKPGGQGAAGAGPQSVRPRTRDSMVERQIQLWNLQQRPRQIPRQSSPQAQTYWPIVTISREFGVEGARVGEALAGRLGFSFWDRRVPETLARMTHSSVDELAPLEERALGPVEEFLSLLLHCTEVPTREYREALALLVSTLERHGSAVIVGRGASFLVNPARALRLRLTAPLEYRVRNYATRERLSLAEAQRVVTHGDRERRTYLMHMGRSRPENVLNYDLVLNIAGMSTERVVETLLDAYRAKFERLPNSALRVLESELSSPSAAL